MLDTVRKLLNVSMTAQASRPAPAHIRTTSIQAMADDAEHFPILLDIVSVVPGIQVEKIDMPFLDSGIFFFGPLMHFGIRLAPLFDLNRNDRITKSRNVPMAAQASRPELMWATNLNAMTNDAQT